MTKVRVIVHFDPVEVDVADIWPDGEVPEAINAQAVADRFDGKLRYMIDAAGLDRLPGSIEVHVPNPSYGGPDSLLPDLIPNQYVKSTVQVP